MSGVVYHANYLRWFERARADMLRALGIRQRDMHEAGEGAYAVSELSIHFAAPARLDDAVLIRSTTTECGAPLAVSAKRLARRALLAAATCERVRLAARRPRRHRRSACGDRHGQKTPEKPIAP